MLSIWILRLFFTSCLFEGTLIYNPNPDDLLWAIITAWLRCQLLGFLDSVLQQGNLTNGFPPSDKELLV